MMKKHIIYGLAALTAANLLACQQKKDEPVKTGSQAETENKFKEDFGQINPAQDWNMAALSHVNVTLGSKGHRVGVYAKICQRWYLLAEQENADEQTTLTYDRPRDIREVYVVVDGMKAYASAPDADVDIPSSKADYSLIQEIAKAERLSWILACEAPCSGDYDFNDLVVRLTKMGDGSVEVTSMAAGLGEAMWLHYSDGNTDYILTPNSHNGNTIETVLVDEQTKYDVEWHGWFKDKWSFSTWRNVVNAMEMTGANFKPGSTVRLSREVLNAPMQMSFLSITNMKSPKGKKPYSAPEQGFYVTVETPTLSLIPEGKEPYDCLISQWPMGSMPQLLVIPDVGGDDTADEYHGWQWPSYKSIINMTYPHFNEWVRDPDMPWYTSTPDGWCDRGAEINDAGKYEIWGYYPR